MQDNEGLADLARRVREAGQVSMTTRQFLNYFSSHRRGRKIVTGIRNWMEGQQIWTAPDFEGAYIDATVSVHAEVEAAGESGPPEQLPDPTVRVGVLPAANERPLRVHRNAPLSEATTLMQLNGLSRLPVMGNEYVVDGMISWESIGGRRALQHPCEYVRHCMEPAEVIVIGTPLVDAMRDISEHGYVLVKGEDGAISGIVTANDIARQFMQLAGPFLVIGEIEGYLRILVHNQFRAEELIELGHEEGRTITGVADLTLGEYCRLLQSPANWGRLNLSSVDHGAFSARLEEVRIIRNDIMHFSPEDHDPSDMQTLLGFARFLRDMLGMNAS